MASAGAIVVLRPLRPCQRCTGFHTSYLPPTSAHRFQVLPIDRYVKAQNFTDVVYSAADSRGKVIWIRVHGRRPLLDSEPKMCSETIPNELPAQGSQQ